MGRALEPTKRISPAQPILAARGLGSVDALHLAAALVLPRDALVLATWDRQLHGAAVAEGVQVVPDVIH